ncbi:MAG: hypothetical protein ACRDPK_05675 [Carbonactinosporaceae bacterium]
MTEKQEAPGRRTTATVDAAGATPTTPGGTAPPAEPTAQSAERQRRRAVFLRELAEARALRQRVTPRRSRAARLRRAMRLRPFRG